MPWPLPALLLALTAGAPAHADTLATARDEPIVEVAHTIDIDVGRGLATLRVRRTFENRGPQADQVETEFSIPEGAAATGLRIKGKKQWYDGLLMEAEMARVAYESLTGYGPWDLKDPAILFWNGLGRLGLFVFPVSPGRPSVIEYTLLVPLGYHNGTYYLAYPTAATQAELAVPGAVLHNSHRGTRFWVNGVSTPAGQSVTLGQRQFTNESDQGAALDDANEEALTDPDELFSEDDIGSEPYQRQPGQALIAVSAPPIDVVDVRFGRFDLTAGKHFTWLDVDTAYPLRSAPRRAQVVFAIDTSRSFGRDGVDAALEFCSAFVAQLPDAAFEVVLFDRSARRLFGRFVSAPEWPALLTAKRAGAALSVANGSFLERGLTQAATALQSRIGPKRVIAVSDALLRTSYRNAFSAQALASLRGDRVVHVVELKPGAADDDVSAGRDDAHTLAAVPLNHGGILFAVSGGARAHDYRRSALELVRPTHIDDFRIVTGTHLADAFSAPAALYEGVGLRHASIQVERATHVTLQGRIWAEPFVRVVPIDPTFSGDVLPALLFGTSLYQDLERGELLRAAIAGKAVSPVTSYLSIEPGTRPSREGFELGGGAGSFGSGAGGLGGRADHGVRIAQLEVDRGALLARLVQQAATPCLARWPIEQPLAVDVECTYAEIVDLAVTDAAPRDLATCVEEALWSIELPAAFSEQRERFSVAIDPLPASTPDPR